MKDTFRNIGKILLIVALAFVAILGGSLYPFLTDFWNWVVTQDAGYAPWTGVALTLLYIGISLVLVILTLAILLVMRSFKTNIFVKEHTKLINISGHLLMVDSILTVIFYAIIQFRTPGGTGSIGMYIIGIAIVFLILALGAYFFAEMFEMAVEYREENDLTV